MLLGLLHATLRVIPQTRRTSGYFLHIATPMSTVFVPLSQFTEYAQTSSHTIELGDIIIYDVEYSCFHFLCEDILYDIMGSERNLILCASIPSCYCKNPIFHINKLCSRYFIMRLSRRFTCIESACSVCCISCGGPCDVTLYGNIGHYENVAIEGYTLALLLWMIRCCRLGYHIRSERERDKILKYMLSYDILGKPRQESEGEYIYILSYIPGIGFQLIPLSGFSS